jgi:hypothetical protein
MFLRSVRATRDEWTRPLPGDDLIPTPIESLTHAITIHRPSREVWPWIAQMGAGTRGGWYSYDCIDNGGRRSADRIRPDLQSVDVGTLFPARPGAIDGFRVLRQESGVSLVLGWLASGTPLVTWAFLLDGVDETITRLVVRARADRDYPFHGLPRLVGTPIIRLAHFVMERKQLLGIAQRVEKQSCGERQGTLRGEVP